MPLSPTAISIYAQIQAAFDVPKILASLLRAAITEHLQTPSNLATYAEFEHKYRLQLNTLLRDSTLSAQRKRLAKLTLKTCLVVLALRDHEASNSSFLYADESELLRHYPEFAGVEELPLLLRFRNIAAVSLTLMPLDNNKAKHLTIATRLTEGKHARYVTGSGQTPATNRRVTILDREGRLVNLLDTAPPTSTSTGSSNGLVQLTDALEHAEIEPHDALVFPDLFDMVLQQTPAADVAPDEFCFEFEDLEFPSR